MKYSTSKHWLRTTFKPFHYVSFLLRFLFLSVFYFANEHDGFLFTFCGFCHSYSSFLSFYLFVFISMAFHHFLNADKIAVLQLLFNKLNSTYSIKYHLWSKAFHWVDYSICCFVCFLSLAHSFSHLLSAIKKHFVVHKNVNGSKQILLHSMWMIEFGWRDEIPKHGDENYTVTSRINCI